MSTPENENNSTATDEIGTVDVVDAENGAVDETEDPGVEAQVDAAEDEADAVEGGEAAVEQADEEQAEAAVEDEAAAEPATDESAADEPEEEVDPVEELRKQLRRAPGDWYLSLIHI